MSYFTTFGSIRKAMLLLAAVLVAGGLSVPAAQAAGATGTVTGTITDSSGDPLEGVYVDIYGVDDEEYGDSAETNAQGRFTVSDVPVGEYSGVLDKDGYVYSYWDGTPEYVSGDQPTFSVAAGATVTNNAVLYVSVTITGHFDPSDVSSDDAFVEFIDTATGEFAGYSYAGDNEDGEPAVYQADGLAPGTYRVDFNRSSGQALHAAQFYNSKAESAGTGAANLITLAEGESKTNVDVDLVEGGKITGRVLDASGAPVDECSIHAYTADGHLVTRSTSTAEDGTFSVGGLTTGAYRIAFNGRGFCSGPERFFDDSSSTNLSQSESDGDTVAVTQGQTKALAEDLVVGDDVPSEPSATRFGGSDRYSTATTISAGVFEPGVDAVFIANGLGFADGLAAGPG